MMNHFLSYEEANQQPLHSQHQQYKASTSDVAQPSTSGSSAAAFIVIDHDEPDDDDLYEEEEEEENGIPSMPQLQPQIQEPLSTNSNNNNNYKYLTSLLGSGSATSSSSPGSSSGSAAAGVPVVCHVCEKHFANSSRLTRHMRPRNARPRECVRGASGGWPDRGPRPVRRIARAAGAARVHAPARPAAARRRRASPDAVRADARRRRARPLRPGGRLPGRDLPLESKANVGGDAQVGKQTVVLKDHADPPPAQRLD